MFDSFFERLGESAATPPDYVKLFTMLLVSYPLAYPLPQLPATLKHVINVATSFFFLFCILNLREGYLQLLGTSLATYVVAKFGVGGEKMPWIVFAGQMGHLTVNHLVRAFGNIPLTTIEITAAQMVLCMNLTSFAWSVHDGRKKEEDLDEQQLEHRVVEYPGLLEFLGYAFFFPGVLIGPSTRFIDYRAWSNNTLYAPKGKSAGVAPPPPGRLRAALTELVFGFLFMGAWSVLIGKYNYDRLILPAGAEGAAIDQPWIMRVWILNVAGFAARTKYYGVWTLTNGACILSGLAYNGVTPIKGSEGTDLAHRTKWDRCRNIDPVKIECANNWKELLDNWNMNTNVWLRNCVYKRVARKGKKPGFKSTMLTFITSAFWHGVAPGYYLTFLLGGFCQSVARTLRRHLRPIAFKDPRAPNPSFSTLFKHSPGQLFYCGLSIVALQLSLNFTVLPFMICTLRESLEGWRVLNYYGVVAVAVLLVAFKAGAGKQLDQISGVAKQRALQKKAAAGQKPNLQVPNVDAAEKEAREALVGLAEQGQEKAEQLKKEL